MYACNIHRDTRHCTKANTFYCAQRNCSIISQYTTEYSTYPVGMSPTTSTSYLSSTLISDAIKVATTTCNRRWRGIKIDSQQLSYAMLSYTHARTQACTKHMEAHTHTHLQLSVVKGWVWVVSYTKEISTVSYSPISPTLGRLYTALRRL